MTEKNMNELVKIFELHSAIVLVYHFGSQVNGTAIQLSDCDFAVYMNIKNINEDYQVKFQLESQISRLFVTDKIDIVILNYLDKPELAYNIIKQGKLIYGKEPYRVLVEPVILNKYFDFRSHLLKHNLVRA